MSKSEKEVLEKQIISEAKSGWRARLYNERFEKIRKFEDPDASEEVIDKRAFDAVANALEGSLDVKKNALKSELEEVRKRPGKGQEADTINDEDGGEDASELYGE